MKKKGAKNVLIRDILDSLILNTPSPLHPKSRNNVIYGCVCVQGLLTPPLSENSMTSTEDADKEEVDKFQAHYFVLQLFVTYFH